MMLKKSLMIGIILSAIFVLSQAANGQEIPLPALDAYQKAILKLADMGAVPSFRDKDLLLIKTDSNPTKLTSEECDCGSMFLLQYIKDKRVKTGVTYQVRFKPIDDKNSFIDLRITIDGYMDVNEDAPFFIEKTRNNNRILMCKSTGVLEKKFAELLLK